jgi:DNA-binding CsgD family transcriptional regulator
MPESNNLSEREREILTLVAKGASNKEIARELHISANTVKVHMRNIFTKVGANSRTEAAMFAVNTGIVDISGNGSSVGKPAETPQNHRNLFIGFGIVIILLVVGIFGFFVVKGSFAEDQVTANQSSVPIEQRWQDRAPLSQARKGLALVAYGGKIFAIAGETEQNVTGLVERYDPILDEWTKLKSKPIPVADVAAAVLGGKIYIPGGRTASGEVTDVLEIYSPIEDEWEKGDDLPIGLSAYALVSYEGYLYLFGGWDGKNAVNSVYQYNPESDQWQALTPMPTARAFSGVSIIEGNIIVIGGYDGERALATNEIYIPDLEDSENSPWELGEPLPNPRYAMGVASMVDTMHVFGGIGETGDPLPSLEYSNRLGSWEIYQSPFDGQWSHLGLVPVGTNLYIVGGDINSIPTGINLTYQAIYTINIPIVR